MSEDWVKCLIQNRGDNIALSWECIRDIIPTHPDEVMKMDLFALGIYGLIIFPRVLGNIDLTTLDLFERMKRKVNLIPAILTETFMSLNASRKHKEGSFRGCAQLLQVWIQSHFWKTPKKVLPDICLEGFSPLQEYLAKEWREDFNKKKWTKIFKNLHDEDIIWQTPWLGSVIHFLYKCGNYNWLMMSGLYGGIACAPLLVSRQFGSRQFVHVTSSLSHTEFAFMVMVQTAHRSWDHCYHIKMEGDSKCIFTHDYDFWRRGRVNDKIPKPDQGPSMSLEEHLRIVPSEADILRDGLEEVKKKMEALQTEHVSELYKESLDVDKRDGTIKGSKKRKCRSKGEDDLLPTGFY
ncbi:hypothetical protein HRI_002669800 [Hibiscus trionum]|uniref:DUF7745 domain-containing protein n=1 Tax=Hibiscus trionum TaxID=183268 RepID=A0A9W7M956_HIBTR|nr:hypothetical protein HRI_002669800 [Hibiscus trionum]